MMTLDLDAIEARTIAPLTGPWTTDRIHVEVARADIRALIAEARRCHACIARGNETLDRTQRELYAKLDEAESQRDLTGAQLLMVGSELCGDPKIDPTDIGDPRNTPTLREAAKLRAERDQLRATVERVRGLLVLWRRDRAVTAVEANELESALRGEGE